MYNLKQMEQQLRKAENLIFTITFMNIIKLVDVLTNENLNYIFKLLYIDNLSLNEIIKKCFKVAQKILPCYNLVKLLGN